MISLSIKIHVNQYPSQRSTKPQDTQLQNHYYLLRTMIINQRCYSDVLGTPVITRCPQTHCWIYQNRIYISPYSHVCLIINHTLRRASASLSTLFAIISSSFLCGFCSICKYKLICKLSRCTMYTNICIFQWGYFVLLFMWI